MAGGGGSKDEVETLKRQLADLQQNKELHSVESNDLQRRLGAMHSEHERKTTETSATVRELQAEVRRLEQSLDKANHELEETLAVNDSLNQELTAALNHPASPRAGTNGSSDPRKLENELIQAQNKSEWLRRENQALEQRCQVAYVGPQFFRRQVTD